MTVGPTLCSAFANDWRGCFSEASSRAPAVLHLVVQVSEENSDLVQVSEENSDLAVLLLRALLCHCPLLGRQWLTEHKLEENLTTVRTE